MADSVFPHMDVVPRWALPAAAAGVFALGALGGWAMDLVMHRHRGSRP